MADGCAKCNERPVAEKVALTAREAARLVGCDPARIYEEVYAGRLAAFRLTPGRLRIPRQALEVWMRTLCETTSPAIAAVPRPIKRAPRGKGC